MSHSLEWRSPLLDQELVSFSCSIPAEWKIRNGRTKVIFKEAVEPMFPSGFFDRPKKGFSVPLRRWFREDLKSYVSEKLISGPLVRQCLINRSALVGLLEEHFSGKRNREDLIWNFLVLSLWAEQYGAV